jgi:flagellar basal body rod protein FlgG
MIYGLYLSATGIMTSSHQQDVIANNIANADTNGFKRSMSLLREREVESRAMRAMGLTHDPLDKIGGGQLLSPTYTDYSQGTIEQTSNPLDTAVTGDGFLAVHDQSGQTRLTRAGALMIDNTGRLITAQGHQVLDAEKKPISLANIPQSELSIRSNGEIMRGQEQLSKIGLFDSSDRASLKPAGENLLQIVGDAQMVKANGKLVGGALEQSNVDPALELTRLMETQRLLEANATMIKYQDATLAKAVNEVGKIG